MYYGNSSATSGSTIPFTYSGTSQLISDSGGRFRLKFLSSGTLATISNMTIDAFLVGGGGGSNSVDWAGGSGGGYTTTGMSIALSIGTSYDAIIGAGGAGGSTSNRGGTTQFASLSAAGGYGNNGQNGGAGGSGGGCGGTSTYSCGAGKGGTNGGNGGSNCASGGSGQSSTTREFGETNGDPYAGGGGGHGYAWNGSGGVWGGGGFGVAGTANSGGGGGARASGGSGVVIIRYTSPSTTNINLYEESNLVAENPWWNTNWRCRQSIDIPNPSAVDQSNLIIKIVTNFDMSTLISDGKIQPNLNDIRFVSSSGNSLTYWIQDNTSNSVDIWAIIPSLPAAGGSIWMYYGNASAASESTPLYNYTGSSQLFDDGNSQFRIKFLDSCTFTIVTSSVYDAFLVGGGASGKTWSTTTGSGGGGGGRTTTISDISLSNSTSYSIVVGAGGGQSGGLGLAGGATSAFSNTANGGSSGTGNGGAGGDGGSGGGGHNGGLGGSNGSDGETKNLAGGIGQHTTTREFGDSTGDMYSYGGNAYNNRTANGTGGLGATGSAAATAGAANSGSGGGGCYNNTGSYATPGDGGSGIVVVRYNPFSIATTINNDTECLPPPVSNCVIEESPNDTQLTVKWVDNASNETGFVIQKSTNGGDWTTIQDVAANTTSHIDTLISSGNTYQYRISPHVSQQAYSFWCYTSILNLGKGNFDFQGLNLEGVNVD